MILCALNIKILIGINIFKQGVLSHNETVLHPIFKLYITHFQLFKKQGMTIVFNRPNVLNIKKQKMEATQFKVKFGFYVIKS